jgi:hypothetical protein
VIARALAGRLLERAMVTPKVKEKRVKVEPVTPDTFVRR